MNIIFANPSQATPRNIEIIQERQRLNLHRTTISQGDFILVNGRLHRVGHVYSPTEIQFGSGSVHLNPSGSCSMSGSMGEIISCEGYSFKGKLEMGSAWIFNNNEAKAHNGVDFHIHFKVWEK